MSKFRCSPRMAFAAFADAPVEGRVEVGMGGRWDAANVINALSPSSPRSA